MSALSPYAVEFVQGKAYAGKLSNPPGNMVDKLSESLAKVKLGAVKPSRPKAGRAYDVSLESMLIETALSTIPQQQQQRFSTAASKSEVSNSKIERKPRRKKIIRPSDSNKKLSKLKKSVVNFREEQAREASTTLVSKLVADLSDQNIGEMRTGRSTCQLATEPDSTNRDEAESDASSDQGCEGSSDSKDIGTSDGGNQCTEPTRSVCDNFNGNDHTAGRDDLSSDEASAEESVNESSSSLLIQPLANMKKQPLKRTPTMDRLKANLQGDALKEVEQLATELIIGLKRFQDRLYNKDEIKARMRQRMYYGLKESIKFMQGQKVKMIIMARDLEAGPGGLDELIENLLSKAKIHRVPVVIALSRNKLKRLSQKPSKVACIAITDPSGRDEQFQKIVEIVKPLGLLEGVSEANLRAEAEDQQRKARQDLETWTSTTRRGRFEFAVDKLFTS